MTKPTTDPPLGLRTVDLKVAMGGTPILHGIDLMVARGQVVAVLGASGSGKSTLLRSIAGLIPSAGLIEAAGRPIHDLPTHRRGVGLMFQEHALFPHLDVAQNVGFGLRELGWSADKIQARVDELLLLAELDGFGHRRVESLSGGEAQRVALVRALAPEPAVLMLDEPLGSLDRRLRDELAGELRRLLASTGTTALYVTHDQAEAATVADRLVVLASGLIIADGTPFELWNRPPTAAIARFMGHLNVTEELVIAPVEIREAEPGAVPSPSPAERDLGDTGDRLAGTIVSSRFIDGLWAARIALDSPVGANTNGGLINQLSGFSAGPLREGGAGLAILTAGSIHRFP